MDILQCSGFSVLFEFKGHLLKRSGCQAKHVCAGVHIFSVDAINSTVSNISSSSRISFFYTSRWGLQHVDVVVDMRPGGISGSLWRVSGTCVTEGFAHSWSVY